MDNSNICGIEDLLQLFEDTLSPSDVLISKLMAQISAAITKERLKLHMTQSEFAEYIGSSQSLVSRWEHGDYNFTIKKIAEIAVKLNLDVNIEMRNISLYQNAEKFMSKLNFPKTTTIHYSESSFCSTLNNTYKVISPFTTLQSNHTEEYYHASICQ